MVFKSLDQHPSLAHSTPLQTFAAHYVARGLAPYPFSFLTQKVCPEFFTSVKNLLQKVMTFDKSPLATFTVTRHVV